MPKGKLGRIAVGADAWCMERQLWLPRVLLLGYLVYVGLRTMQNPEYRSLFSGLTLVLHEAGHLAFAFFGQALSVAGGTLLQLAAPLGASYHLMRRQRDYFGLCVGLCWTSYSLWDVAVYMADARRMALPLIGFGSGDPIHDWNYLLRRLGLLAFDRALAGAVWTGALLLWLAACLAASWLCWRTFLYRTGRLNPNG